MHDVMRDIRQAFRMFSRQRAFMWTAVLSLGIGIGVNTAIFSVANALLFKPLPYEDSGRLAILWNRSPGIGIAEDWFSTAQYFDIKDNTTSFEQLAIALGSTVNLSGGGGEPERVGVIRVSSNLLPMLGAKPAIGSLFEVADDSSGRSPKAVLSHATWVRRFGSDPGAVGKTILVNGEAIPVVGVLSQEFSLPHEVLPTLGVTDDGEIFMPLPMAAGAPTVRGREDFNIMGKLKQGVSVAQAQAELDVLTARLRREFPAIYPPNGGLTFNIVPLLEQVVGNVRTPLFILLGAVGFVLLIACANVANLMLSRAIARQREMTVRVALGASRRRIAQQLFTESVLLAFIGATLGVIIALAGIAWLQALQPPNIPRLRDIGITPGVLAFTGIVAIASAILSGVAPAVGMGRLDLQSSLKDAARTTGSGLWGRGGHLRRFIVVGELALSVVLLAGAGLLIRSFAELRSVPLGFESSNVLTFELATSGSKYPNGPSVQNAWQQIWQRLNAIPGVQHAGSITSLPLSGHMAWGPITIEGFIPPGGEDFINADQRIVGGQYFEAMQIPLVAGRYFNDTDRADAARVAIVDQSLAEQYWPDGDAIGKRLRTGPVSSNSTNWMTVVGVVERVKQYGVDADNRVVLYLPHGQFASRAGYVTVRTSGDPSGSVAAVRAALKEFDADLPMYRVRSMDERVDASLARPRFAMTLLTVFASLALVLAAIGIYGVLAYLVSQSTRDIGIRMALGATQRNVLAMVVRQGAYVTVAGLVVGIAGAWALSRFMKSLLFGVSGADATTFAFATFVLSVIAISAAMIPARRAARVDPMVALRSD